MSGETNTNYSNSQVPYGYNTGVTRPDNKTGVEKPVPSEIEKPRQHSFTKATIPTFAADTQRGRTESVTNPMLHSNQLPKVPNPVRKITFTAKPEPQNVPQQEQINDIEQHILHNEGLNNQGDEKPQLSEEQIQNSVKQLDISLQNMLTLYNKDPNNPNNATLPSEIKRLAAEKQNLMNKLEPSKTETSGVVNATPASKLDESLFAIKNAYTEEKKLRFGTLKQTSDSTVKANYEHSKAIDQTVKVFENLSAFTKANISSKVEEDKKFAEGFERFLDMPQSDNSTYGDILASTRAGRGPVRKSPTHSYEFLKQTFTDPIQLGRMITSFENATSDSTSPLKAKTVEVLTTIVANQQELKALADAPQKVKTGMFGKFGIKK